MSHRTGIGITEWARPKACRRSAFRHSDDLSTEPPGRGWVSTGDRMPTPTRMRVERSDRPYVVAVMRRAARDCLAEKCGAEKCGAAKDT